RLVVAGVVRLPRRAAEGRGLLVGLDALGTREETTRGDPGVDEREVVAASVERRRRGRQALRGEVVEEGLLDRGRSLRARLAERIPVTVVHEAHGVRRADNVEVEVEQIGRASCRE